MKYFIYGSNNVAKNKKDIVEFLDSYLSNPTFIYTMEEVSKTGNTTAKIIADYAAKRNIKCSVLHNLFPVAGGDGQKAVIKFCLDNSDKHIFFIKYNEYPNACIPLMEATKKADARYTVVTKVLQ